MPNRKLLSLMVAFAICVSTAGTFVSVYAQDEKKEEEKEKPKFKEYAEVVTEKAITSEGVFKTHLVEDKLYYEIPEREMGRLFLWVTQVAKYPTGKGYGGTSLNNRTVRWDRRGDKIDLKDVQHRIRADERLAVYKAVSTSSFPNILYTFNIETFGEDGSVVIDVTPMFTSDTPEFSPKKRLEARALDKKRTYVERAAAYEKNVELDVVMTFSTDKEGNNLGSLSTVVHHSMVHLPDNPMRGRLYDSRVGFFSHSHVDFGIDSHEAETRRMIARWRLEKKNPGAAMSEPVKPIVYYIDRSVPEKWVPYMIQGVNDWQAAFEQAGFKNAIIGKAAPSWEEDPGWNTEDATIASISWLASEIQNAYGPHVSDPRTGEILDSDIKFYHNVVKLARDWYFVQASPMDPRAQKLPMPDDLMGELVRYITAHEVGHAIGLQHNMKASSSYTVENLRDPEFTRKYGNEASIMDYGRFNYVAQPGDGARLIPMIGPYDKFAIEWGYKELPYADTPDTEREELNKIASRQSDNPMLRFGSSTGYDPSAQTEDLGSDPVAATALGIMNLKRVAKNLIPATSHTGEDYSLLNNMYGSMIGQFNREVRHVSTLVGGVVKTNNFVGQEGKVFDAVSYEKQKEAMMFLNENAFKMPEEFLDTEVLDRIQPSGNSDRVLGVQRGLIRRLLSENRAKRMIDYEAKASDGEQVYRLDEMLMDMRDGIWSELKNGGSKIDPYRRNLQRTHVEELIAKIEGENASSSDLRPLARGELMDISKLIKKNVKKFKDRTSNLHLEDINQKINKVLNSNN